MLSCLGSIAVVLGLAVVCVAGELDENPQDTPPIGLPARPPAPEMKVLEKLVGAWTTHSINKVSEWNPQESRSSGKAVAKLILGGQFLLCENAADQGEPYGITIFNYDPGKKSYRSWIFDALGNTVEASGQWDRDTQTLSFTPVGKPGTNQFTFRFLDDQTTEYTIQGRDDSGRLLIDVQGRWVRRPTAE